MSFAFFILWEAHLRVMRLLMLLPYCHIWSFKFSAVNFDNVLHQKGSSYMFWKKLLKYCELLVHTFQTIQHCKNPHFFWIGLFFSNSIFDCLNIFHFGFFAAFKTEILSFLITDWLHLCTFCSRLDSFPLSVSAFFDIDNHGDK